MEKINIIIPLTKDIVLNEKIKQLTSAFTQYENEFFVLILASKLIEKPKNYKNAKNTKFIKTELTSENELITKGFETIESGATIILDISRKNCITILEKILKVKTADNIIKIKEQASKTNAVKKYFQKIFSKIYAYYLKFFGLEKDLLCSNHYGYFNENATQVIKSMPKENAYLRNFNTFSGYEQKIITEECDEVKNNRYDFLNWKDFGVRFSVFCLSLSVIIFLLTLVFSKVVLGLESGIAYYFILLGLTFIAAFLSGYILIKNIIHSRGNL